MPFFVGNRDACRLAVRTVVLIAGACTAFAMPACAGLWPHFAYLAVVVFLAAWGWGARGLLLPALFVLGALVAFRADDARVRILASNARLGGERPVLELEVEGDVVEWTRKRDDAPLVSFASHVGPLPLRVVLPRPTEGLPQIGETWRCPGWISHKPPHENRFARRTLWVSGEGRAPARPQGEKRAPARPQGEKRASARPSAMRVVPAPTYSPAVVYAACAEELGRRARVGLDWCAELAGFNQAILLGSRGGLTRERRALFAAAGTIHVFAISGLHVMVVAGLITGLLRRFDVSLRARGLVAVPLLVAYTLLTGARPSAVRAALMAVLWFLAPVFGRRPDPLAAWSVTAFAVYLFHPERLFDVGCTLSFAVMFGIVLWIDGTRYLVSPLPGEAEAGWRRMDWKAKLRRKVGAFAQAMGVSFAAWVASVPVTACVFGRFTVGGLVANVVLVVCAKWMVTAGVTGLVASFVCLPLGAICNNATAALTGVMVLASERVASWPWASVEVRPWGAWACLAWYVAWGALFAVLCRFWPRRVPFPRAWWSLTQTKIHDFGN